MLIRHWLVFYLKQEAFFLNLTSKFFLQMSFLRIFIFIFFKNPTQASKNSLDGTLECVMESRP